MKPDYTETLRGYTIEIYQDSDPLSPNENADRHAFLVYGHRSFTVNGPDGEKAKDIHESLDEWKEKFHVYPVYAYIHSGVRLQLGSDEGLLDRQLDVSMCGYVLITKDEKEIPNPEKYAQGMIDEWNQYLSADVWGYQIKAGDEDFDSCWGFYGLEYCKEEARRAVPDNLYCSHENVELDGDPKFTFDGKMTQGGTCTICGEAVQAEWHRGQWKSF